MMPHMRPLALISRAFPACLLVAASLGAGCAGEGSHQGVLGSLFGPEQPVTATSQTRPSQENEPMTLFEKRRLVARLQQDPRALQRLTPRERREVAAMTSAAQRNQDEDERD
jgi:hypothetical protein